MHDTIFLFSVDDDKNHCVRKKLKHKNVSKNVSKKVSGMRTSRKYPMRVTRNINSKYQQLQKPHKQIF